MTLLDVSIGQVQTVQIGTEIVRTAHIKAPVAKPWTITADGVAGDQRAIHPDKLYAFARSAYAHWGNCLKIDPAHWPNGFFGENLTLDTLDEQDLRVGDELALGDEVRLVVAGARTPCVKLAWRLGQPRTFQRVFALSRQTGIYLGVLMPGRVRPGDTLRRVRHDPTMPSIADLCDYIASHDPPPLAPLEHVLANPHLSPTNRLLLSAKLEAARRAELGTVGGWHGWRSFEVRTIVEETDAIRSVHLYPVDGPPLGRSRPGQHVALRMRLPAGAIVRHWSLSSHVEEPDHYRLTVRRQGGAGSAWVHAASAGTHVELRSASGNFVLDEGSYRPLVLVAGGIGITPLLAMLHAHLRRPGHAPAHLIYGARKSDEAAFQSEIEALCARHPELVVHHVYSRVDQGRRISADLLIELLNDLHVVLADHRIDLPWFEADIYICGPGELCRVLPDELVARGANADHIFTERFDTIVAGATDIQSAQISFAKSGRTATWTAVDDQSLMELARDAGVVVTSDCESGTCLTCMTAVIEGETTVDTGDGSTLLCVARPKTDVLTLNI